MAFAIVILGIAGMLTGLSISNIWKAEAKLRERVDALERERKGQP